MSILSFGQDLSIVCALGSCFVFKVSKKGMTQGFEMRPDLMALSGEQKDL